MNKSLNDIIQKVRENRKPIRITKADKSTSKSDVEMKDSTTRTKRIRPQRRHNHLALRSNNGPRSRRNFTHGRSKGYTRLFISNLKEDITNADLKTIFEKIGPLKRCGIHWNELGHSKGTADVEYVYAQDAYRAKKRYNNNTIGGVPIRIEVHSKVGRDSRRIRERRRIGFRKQYDLGRRRKSFNKNK